MYLNPPQVFSLHGYVVINITRHFLTMRCHRSGHIMRIQSSEMISFSFQKLGNQPPPLGSVPIFLPVRHSMNQLYHISVFDDIDRFVYGEVIALGSFYNPPIIDVLVTVTGYLTPKKGRSKNFQDDLDHKICRRSILSNFFTCCWCEEPLPSGYLTG